MARRGAKLKTEGRGAGERWRRQIGFDIRSCSDERRGYRLSRAMSQPLMGQRSDVLISLIDGLEAHNSQQREDDQERTERQRSLSKQSG